MQESQTNSAIGYGLLGLGLGLGVFSILYLVFQRADVSVTTSGSWLLILLAIILVPTLVGAGIGYSKAGKSMA